MFHKRYHQLIIFVVLSGFYCSRINSQNQFIKLSQKDQILAKPLYSTIALKYYDHQRVLSIVQVSQQNNRPYQEDRAIVISDDRFVGIGLFDGHGGAEVSEKLSAKNGLIFESLDCFSKSQHAKRDYYTCDLLTFFVDFNEKHFKNSKAGSTAVCAFFLPDRIMVANVGDSRAIDSDGNAITKDHKPFFKEEEDRIKKAGGFVLWPSSLHEIKDIPRVSGNLAISRAFGDTSVKGITAVPDIFQNTYELKNNFYGSRSSFYKIKRFSRRHVKKERKSDQFIIIACDGLWDFLPDKIQGYVPSCPLSENIDQILSDQALHHQFLTEFIKSNIIMNAPCQNRIAAYIVNKILDVKGFNKDGFEHAALALMLATIQKEEFDTNKCITLSKEDLQKLVHAGKNEVFDNQTIIIVGWQNQEQSLNIPKEIEQPKNLIQPEPIQQRRQPHRRYLRRRFRNRKQIQNPEE
jgi:serine/threonine protein phosphatase PrpC